MLQLTGIGCSRQPETEMAQSGIIPLPYSHDALEPYISSRTLEFHYNKHHQAYAANTLKLITGTNLAKLPLTEIIQKSHGVKELVPTYNNAAQLFNHNFYWQSMTPKGGGKPQGKIQEAITQSFGSYDAFVDCFRNQQPLSSAAAGPGW